jgi:hypothetical protein
MSAVTAIVQCPRNPGTETALRCSRCDTPICPQCLVQTPVGARCRDCARIVKSPIYTLSGGGIARALVATLIGAVVMGVVWGWITASLPGLGLFSFFAGAGLGYAFTRLLELATNHKRGPGPIAFAVSGICLAFLIQLVVAGVAFDSSFLRYELGALIALGVGIYFAYQNLR